MNSRSLLILSLVGLLCVGTIITIRAEEVERIDESADFIARKLQTTEANAATEEVIGKWFDSNYREVEGLDTAPTDDTIKCYEDETMEKKYTCQMTPKLGVTANENLSKVSDTVKAMVDEVTKKTSSRVNVPTNISDDNKKKAEENKNAVVSYLKTKEVTGGVFGMTPSYAMLAAVSLTAGFVAFY